MRQALKRVELEHATRWVDRTFEKDHSRCFLQRLAPRAGLEWVDECRADTHADDVFSEELARPAVDPGAGDQVIARPKECEHRARRRTHTAREHQRGFSAFE